MATASSPSHDTAAASEATADSELALRASWQRSTITDRVNAEPAIVNGMNVTEAKYMSLVTFPVCILLGGLMFGLTGLWHFLLLLGMFGPLVVLWFGSLRLAVLKRDRPDGHYTQALHLWMADRGWVVANYLRYFAEWDIGVSLGWTFGVPYYPSLDADLQPVRPPLPQRVRTVLTTQIAPVVAAIAAQLKRRLT